MVKLYSTIIITIGLLLPFTLMAQSRAITGKVVNEKGEEIAGVVVVVKDAINIATLTDAKGDYSIKLPANSNTLVFSFLGLESQELNVSSTATRLNVTMKEKSSVIDQVVVTGYAQTTRKMMTGSVGVLTADELENKPQTSVDALLQGQLAGVVVEATSGQPGRDQKIRIRGSNTLSGSLGYDSSPLWIVDGVPLQGQNLSLYESQLKSGGFEDLFITGIGDINPNDIENISVLKDAAAAAIYGSRAANGVIVITTKRGKEGKIKVNYSANMSLTLSPQRDGNLMNSKEKLAWEQELWDEFSAERLAQGEEHVPVVGIVGMIRKGVGDFKGMTIDEQNNYIAQLGKSSTNWFDEIFRNSISTNQHISASGGNEKNLYYVSLGYSFGNGLLKKDTYDRYNLLANYNIKPSDKVRFDLGLEMTQQKSKSPNLSSIDPFAYAYFANPYEKPYNEDGSYRSDLTYNNLAVINGDDYTPTDARGYNIMREIDNTSSNTKSWKTTARLESTVKLASTLNAVGLVSYSFSNNRTDKINQKDTFAAFEDRFDSNQSQQYFGSLLTNTNNMTSYIARMHLTYNEDYGESHRLSIIAGTEIRGSDSKAVYRKGYGYDPKTGSTIVPPPIGGEASTKYLNEVNQLSGDYYSDNRYASFYFSSDYYFQNRYIVNFTLRTDGNSHFGSDEQFNPNWSVGAAWHLMNEKFMKRLSPVVDWITIRAATGFTGNTNNGVSPKLIMTYWDNEYRSFGDINYPRGRFTSAPNPQLRWEKKHDMKASIDFGLFKGRFSAVFEVYRNKSTDVVYSSKIPTLTGFAWQKFNSVDIVNNGWELTLNGKIVDNKNFKLTASANLSYNANKVTKFVNTLDKLDIGDKYMEGYPTNSILGGKLVGIDDYTGLYTYKLRSDATINTQKDLQNINNYRFYLGTAEAPYTGGFNVRGAYKSLSLSVSGVFSLNSKTYEALFSPASYGTLSVVKPGDVAERPQTYFNDLYNNHLNVMNDRPNRWTEPYEKGIKYPRILDAYGESYGFTDTNPSGTNITHGAYLKNNSYLRIKSIILNYDFPNSIASKMGMSNLSVNMSLNNFFTFTSYDGLDPETPGALYPITRSVTFGLIVGF